MHGHIVFNSVNRMSGYKYRYKNGDWEKYIQPITDRICEKHGVAPLEYDGEIKKGKSYAQWDAERKGKTNWKKIICADIDYIISISENETEFLRNMKKIGYQIRKGNSQKHGIYFAIKAIEQKRAWRSYNLGNGYSYSEILSRLEKERFEYQYPKSPRIQSVNLPKAVLGNSIPEFQKKRIRKMYFISFGYHNVKNPYVVDYREVRKSVLHIDQLWENIRYLNRNKINSYEELLDHELRLIEQEKRIKNQIYRTNEQQGNEEKLQVIRKEKRIIRRIKKEEEGEFFYIKMEQPGMQIQNKKKKEADKQWMKNRKV